MRVYLSTRVLSAMVQLLLITAVAKRMLHVEQPRWMKDTHVIIEGRHSDSQQACLSRCHTSSLTQCFIDVIHFSHKQLYTI